MRDHAAAYHTASAPSKLSLASNRKETIVAEDILQDLGALSIVSSDSQAMGRVGEVISRTWQTADKMKYQFGRLPEEQGDNGQALMKKSGTLGLAKKLLPVSNTRKIGKRSMLLNSATPRMEVNPETYEVRADGRLLTCPPAKIVPMAQRYFMY